MLRRLAGIDQTGRHLNDDLIDWRTILLLQKQFRPRGFVEDGDNAYAIDLAIGGPSLDVMS